MAAARPREDHSLGAAFMGFGALSTPQRVSTTGDASAAETEQTEPFTPGSPITLSQLQSASVFRDSGPRERVPTHAFAVGEDDPELAQALFEEEMLAAGAYTDSEADDEEENTDEDAHNDAWGALISRREQEFAANPVRAQCRPHPGHHQRYT